jgi:XRE family transcriptional regulator, fatty acid utilization regulator
LFDATRPDLHELRAAQAHAPTLIAAFLRLHRSYLVASDQFWHWPRNRAAQSR